VGDGVGWGGGGGAGGDERFIIWKAKLYVDRKFIALIRF